MGHRWATRSGDTGTCLLVYRATLPGSTSNSCSTCTQAEVCEATGTRCWSVSLQGIRINVGINNIILYPISGVPSSVSHYTICRVKKEVYLIILNPKNCLFRIRTMSFVRSCVQATESTLSKFAENIY